MGFPRIGYFTLWQYWKSLNASKTVRDEMPLTPRIIVVILLLLIFCNAVSKCCSASTWKYGIPFEVTAPNRTSDLFAGGWRLENAECSETGVYYYKFTMPEGKKLSIALSIAAVTGRGSGVGKSFSFFSDGYPASRGFSPEVLALRDELSSRVERWESRIQRTDAFVCGRLWRRS